MVKLSGLKISEKSVREVVNSPQGLIEVYEPTTDIVGEIIEIQKGTGEDGTVTIDGFTVIKELFPLLTNLEMDDLTDEEIMEVVENPSIHFLMVQQAVAQIISEANKLYTERLKSELLNADSNMAVVELMNTLPSVIVKQAKENGEIGELAEKTQEAFDLVQEALNAESATEQN